MRRIQRARPKYPAAFATRRAGLQPKSIPRFVRHLAADQRQISLPSTRAVEPRSLPPNARALGHPAVARPPNRGEPFAVQFAPPTIPRAQFRRVLPVVPGVAPSFLE